MDTAISNYERETDALEQATMRRVAWRLLPAVMAIFFCGWLCKANVGMAATTMNRDMAFSNAVFGFGAGLFFLGYILFGVPSNLILHRVGAKRWLGVLLLFWGVFSGLTAFIWNDRSFYGFRLLTGLSEAGLQPGIILYLTWWFPSRYRARAFGLFIGAAVISLIIGPPISGLLLRMGGVLALQGWQWLFLLEALPSVVMCFVTWWVLTDRPTEARWLSPDQQGWLTDQLNAERAQREAVRKYSLGEVFYDPKVWLLAAVDFCSDASMFGVVMFTPLIVKGLGVTTNWIGVATAVPSVFAFVAMNYWARHSDLAGERIWHTVGPYLLIAVAFVASALVGANHPVLLMVAVIAASMGIWCGSIMLWTLPPSLLTGSAAAGGFALIKGVSGLGAWFGPTVFGLVKDWTGSDSLALFSLTLLPIITALGVLTLRHDPRLQRTPPRALTMAKHGAD